MNNIPDRTLYQEHISNKELTGICKALNDYKKDTLKLHKLTVSTDCLLESLEAERSFRISITNDLRTIIEINCANCPMGFTKDTCEVQCPYKTIENILNDKLKQLDQILPGGLNNGRDITR